MEEENVVKLLMGGFQGLLRFEQHVCTEGDDDGVLTEVVEGDPGGTGC